MKSLVLCAFPQFAAYYLYTAFANAPAYKSKFIVCVLKNLFL